MNLVKLELTSELLYIYKEGDKWHLLKEKGVTEGLCGGVVDKKLQLHFTEICHFIMFSLHCSPEKLY